MLIAASETPFTRQIPVCVPTTRTDDPFHGNDDRSALLNVSWVSIRVRSHANTDSRNAMSSSGTTRPG